MRKKTCFTERPSYLWSLNNTFPSQCQQVGRSRAVTAISNALFSMQEKLTKFLLSVTA